MSGGGGGNILNPIQSARLRLSRSFYSKFGRVEVRAKMPRGDWIWPAVWMLPRFNQYGPWPASGEIGHATHRHTTHTRQAAQRERESRISVDISLMNDLVFFVAV